MNNQELILNFIQDKPGNVSDVKAISRWTGLNARAIYKAIEHLKNRGAIKKKQEIFIEKNHSPIRKIKIFISPKTRSKATWILNKTSEYN